MPSGKMSVCLFGPSHRARGSHHRRLRIEPLMDSFLLAVTARAVDAVARRSGAPLGAAISLEALPEAMLLLIAGLLPLHARVRACGIARWFRRELPRAVELWNRLEFEPCCASERITDRDLEGLLQRIGAARATRVLGLRACGPGVTGSALAALAGSRVLEELDLCGRSGRDVHALHGGGPLGGDSRGGVDVAMVHAVLSEMMSAGAAGTRLRRLRYEVAETAEYDVAGSAGRVDARLAAMGHGLALLELERDGRRAGHRQEGHREPRCGFCGKASAASDGSGVERPGWTIVEQARACWQCGRRTCTAEADGDLDGEAGGGPAEIYGGPDGEPEHAQAQVAGEAVQRCPHVRQCSLCACSFCAVCAPEQGACVACGITACAACSEAVRCALCSHCCCVSCGARRCAYCGDGYCAADADFDKCARCGDASGCPKCCEMELCDMCDQMLCQACSAFEECDQCRWLVCDACAGCGCDRIRGVIDQSKVPVTRRHPNQLPGCNQRGH